MIKKPYNDRLVFILTPFICIGFVILAYSGLMDVLAIQALWTVLLVYYTYLIVKILNYKRRFAKSADSTED